MQLFCRKSKRDPGSILVIGATGKTGSRVAERLAQRGLAVRLGSRSATPRFDWLNHATWSECLEGVEAVYISYAGDLAVPGTAETIKAFLKQAEASGVKRAVLLTGRGEAEAQRSEQALRETGLEWTIVRASWFNQNFSEGAFADMVQAGEITLSAGDTLEPFIDADDIADVAVAALTEPGHAGELYEVTGPRLMTFADVSTELSEATNREITYTDIPHETFIAGVAESGAPEQVVSLLDYLFGEILDGRNASVTNDVERALGRPAKDFSAFARSVSATGYWRAEV